VVGRHQLGGAARVEVEHVHAREAEVLVHHDRVVALALPALLVGRRVALGDEGDASPVGRPLEAGDRRLALGDLLGLAAERRDHEELRPLAAGGDEGEPAAVGRPARRVVGLLAGRQAHRRAAAGGHEPEVGVRRVLGRVGGRHDVGDPLPVGRELRVAHLPHGQHVLEGERARHGGRGGRRRGRHGGRRGRGPLRGEHGGLVRWAGRRRGL
jgi:hypothetical protein